MKKILLIMVCLSVFAGCGANNTPNNMEANTIMEEVPLINLQSGNYLIYNMSAKTSWNMTDYDRLPIVDLLIKEHGLEPSLIPKGSRVEVIFNGDVPDEIVLKKCFVGDDGTVYPEYFMDLEIVHLEGSKYSFIYGEESSIITEDNEQLGSDALFSGYCMTCSWQDGLYEADYGFLIDEDGSFAEIDESLWQEAKSPEHDTLADVWMETELEVYPVGTTELDVKWYNTSNEEMMFGEGFQLQKEVDGVWRIVEKQSDINYGWNDIGIILNQQDQRWHSYWLTPFTYGLTQGHYRISTSFFRETQDGIAIETRPYPTYQIYGYFYVGEEAISRDMTNIFEGRIEYRDETCGLVVYLPESWAGFSVIMGEQTPDHEAHRLFSELDDHYYKLIIRHPNWEELAAYQDIVITVMNRYDWNNNAESATGGDFEGLPERIAGGNDLYLLVKDEEDYSPDQTGYEEVMEILNQYIKW